MNKMALWFLRRGRFGWLGTVLPIAWHYRKEIRHGVSLFSPKLARYIPVPKEADHMSNHSQSQSQERSA